MKKLTRTSTVTPGFDCMYAPCQHKPKGDHGIHGEEWRYSVSDGKRALSLLVFTTRFPETVPADALARMSDLGKVSGANLSLHKRVSRGGQSCDLLGKCKIEWSSGLMAGDFVKEHAIDAPEQTESFWKALEEKFYEMVQK